MIQSPWEIVDGNGCCLGCCLVYTRKHDKDLMKAKTYLHREGVTRSAASKCEEEMLRGRREGGELRSHERPNKTTTCAV